MDERDFGTDYNVRKANDEYFVERESGPICSFCEGVITDKYYYYFCGEIYCKSCVDTQFRKRTSEW